MRILKSAIIVLGVFGVCVALSACKNNNDSDAGTGGTGGSAQTGGTGGSDDVDAGADEDAGVTIPGSGGTSGGCD